MYKFSVGVLRKFISIHELRPIALLGMVFSSLTTNTFCNVAAATFLAIVHLPPLIVQDKNRLATLGSASLVTGSLAKISTFTTHFASALLLSSLAPTLGNFLFSLLKIRDAINNRNNPPLFMRDIALSTCLVLATLLMSLPLWTLETSSLAMAIKPPIILSALASISLMLNLRYSTKS